MVFNDFLAQAGVMHKLSQKCQHLFHLGPNTIYASRFDYIVTLTPVYAKSYKDPYKSFDSDTLLGFDILFENKTSRFEKNFHILFQDLFVEPKQFTSSGWDNPLRTGEENVISEKLDCIFALMEMGW